MNLQDFVEPERCFTASLEKFTNMACQKQTEVLRNLASSICQEYVV